jgi:peptidyl-prolyl cis-trans isomerase SurA
MKHPAAPLSTAQALCLAVLGLAFSTCVHAQGLKAAGGLGGPSARAAIQQANEPVTTDFIVAVVNNEPITNQEVQSRVRRATEQMGRTGAPVPPRPQLREQVLESLILEKAQLQLATEQNIRVDDVALDDAERTVARQNQLTVTQMHEQLKAQGLDLSEFRANLRKQLLLQRLREREVEPRVKVTEPDVERFLLQKQDNPGSDLQVHLAQVLVAVPETVEPQKLASLMSKAQMVAEKARAGADFAALAREYSDAPDRAAGGSLGLRAADRLPVLFINATRSQSAGGVAGPVRSPAGFHVLKVIEKRIAGMPEPFVSQTRARHILLRTSPSLSEQAAVTRLADMRRRIMSGQADFATLAKENSQDGSAADGGNLGWVGPGTFVPEFEDVMNGLQLQALSDPVVSRFGVHLIQVMERRQVELTAREQREQLRMLVREQKLDEAYQKWLEDLRLRAYVEMRESPQ